VTYDDFRHRADAVRSLPLETVLLQWGARRDRRDRRQWRAECGPITVTGSQFFNWHNHRGGGGAIDLVMHLGGIDNRTAIKWLEQHLGTAQPRSATSSHDVSTIRRALRLPAADHSKLLQVRSYLAEQRRLPQRILTPLIEAGKLYADQRANAVFLMVTGKPNRPIGAELRGTGPSLWRGLAPGTCKDGGYFWIGDTASNRIIICESAIDAISCFQLHSPCICISTAGARPHPPWLQPLLARRYHIHCGFDDDPAGNNAAQQMIARHASIKRLRPPAHDWNDALVSQR
jgi:hypothetical protein